MKFDKDPLVVRKKQLIDQNSKRLHCLSFRCFARKFYENFKSKNCLFGATNIVKTSDKEKNVYSGYGTTFDSADSCRFDNDIAGNVIAFDVANK